MANITASMVKELREMTGAGMMECKKALAEADGDMDGAVDVLRTRGLAAVAKKAGRATNEGTVMTVVADDAKSAAVVELNCETDFVGMNEKFKAYAEKIAKAALAAKPADVEALKAAVIDGETVEDVVTDCIHVMGENTQLARVAVVDAQAVSAYIHGGGKIGVMVRAESPAGAIPEVLAAAKDCALQVAAMNPPYLKREDVPASVLDEEKKIILAQMAEDPKMANKPDQVKEKIAAGKVGKYYGENCLLEQAFVKENKETVQSYVDGVAKAAGTTIKITDFVRFERGEGIEKKADNFAEEIASMIK